MTYLDFSVRAVDAAAFWAAARSIGLAVLDETGIPIAVKGANIAILGPVLKKGIDPQGEGPFEYWPNFHANVRIDTRELPDFSAVLGQWLVGGIATPPHAAEFTVSLNGKFSGVELVENVGSASAKWA